uniref:Uncharacterized protein n=1 Tax=Caenorhabditis elegans TaxID=6239 RepID=O17277_CAEEL|eukprot:NP_493748.1 Uncharacterized protein CELE_T27A1.1 [Caenorhabditis elegans]
MVQRSWFEASSFTDSRLEAGQSRKRSVARRVCVTRSAREEPRRTRQADSSPRRSILLPICNFDFTVSSTIVNGIAGNGGQKKEAYILNSDVSMETYSAYFWRSGGHIPIVVIYGMVFCSTKVESGWSLGYTGIWIFKTGRQIVFFFFFFGVPFLKFQFYFSSSNSSGAWYHKGL